MFYFLALSFLFFLDFQAVRKLLFWLDPTLKTVSHAPEDTTTCRTDCTLSFANLWSRFDVFILCHISEWVWRAMFVRSVTVCWSISIFWEVTEALFDTLLPVLCECWWDKWIYDVLLCNGGGILIGHMLGKHLKMKQYHWLPEVGWKRFMPITFLIGSSTVMSLNAFFLKHIFEVPAKHWLNVGRFVLILSSAHLRCASTSCTSRIRRASARGCNCLCSSASSLSRRRFR
eukprot:NODE_2136_length_988_cov_332.964630.p1 GENE.NODE_2136_length_988_cov_332.964630~~NODE_2136_length_988_cov_332.964630.p1  ORF type:complete len:261 (+),score=31.84 NODE_2136_length_988_cov_332.964630:94-783(+)